MSDVRSKLAIVGASISLLIVVVASNVYREAFAEEHASDEVLKPLAREVQGENVSGGLADVGVKDRAPETRVLSPIQAKISRVVKVAREERLSDRMLGDGLPDTKSARDAISKVTDSLVMDGYQPARECFIDAYEGKDLPTERMSLSLKIAFAEDVGVFVENVEAQPRSDGELFPEEVSDCITQMFYTSEMPIDGGVGSGSFEMTFNISHPDTLKPVKSGDGSKWGQILAEQEAQTK